MRYLKLFENFKAKEKKFSVTFDEKYLYDVISALKKHNIKYKVNDNTYYHLKKKVELFAWSDDSTHLLKIIPVNNLHVLRVRKK